MDLRVNLKLDGSGFTQGLTSLRQGLNTSFSGMQSQLAAAFSVGAIVALSKKTIDYASKMRDLSDRLGVNVEWLQRMANTANLAGGSVEDLANLMNELGRSREEALRDPKSKAATSLGRLGFTEPQIRNQTQQQFLDQLVKSFSNGASVQMENDVIEVGGRSAKKLLAAFAQGIDESQPIMAEWLIDELDNTGDEFTRFGQTLMVELGPALAFATDMLRTFIQRIEQTAAGLGGLTSRVNVGGLVKAQGSGLGIWYLLGKMIKGWGDFQDETNRVATTQEERNDEIDLAREAARKRRREREKGPPNFDIAAKEDKEKLTQVKKAEINSDALIAVGNFLGTTNRSNIESIQMETNRILRDHTRILTKISEGRVATSSWDDLGLPDSGTATSSF